MARAPDEHRLDRAPDTLREDPRSQGAGTYTGSPDDRTRAGALPNGDGNRESVETDRTESGSRERPAYGTRADDDFGRDGRSVNSPPSLGPLGDMDREEREPRERDPYAGGERAGERWRSGEA